MRAEAGGMPAATTVRTRRPALPLPAWVALCVASGVLVGLEYPPGTWYAALAKPGPTLAQESLALAFWALLALCGVAAWRVDRRRVPQRPYALRLFLVQLALGCGWAAICFGAHALGPAVAVMTVLWLAIVATVVAFSRLDRPAAALMTPWLAWVTFLLQQNIAWWTLNA